MTSAVQSRPFTACATWSALLGVTVQLTLHARDWKTFPRLHHIVPVAGTDQCYATVDVHVNFGTEEQHGGETDYSAVYLHLLVSLYVEGALVKTVLRIELAPESGQEPWVVQPPCDTFGPTHLISGVVSGVFDLAFLLVLRPEDIPGLVVAHPGSEQQTRSEDTRHDFSL